MLFSSTMLHISLFWANKILKKDDALFLLFVSTPVSFVVFVCKWFRIRHIVGRKLPKKCTRISGINRGYWSTFQHTTIRVLIWERFSLRCGGKFILISLIEFQHARCQRLEPRTYGCVSNPAVVHHHVDLWRTICRYFPPWDQVLYWWGNLLKYTYHTEKQLTK